MWRLSHHPDCDAPREVCICRPFNWSTNKEHHYMCPVDKKQDRWEGVRLRATNWDDPQGALLWIKVEINLVSFTRTVDEWFVAHSADVRPMLDAVKAATGWPKGRAYIDIDVKGRFITSLRVSKKAVGKTP